MVISQPLGANVRRRDKGILQISLLDKERGTVSRYQRQRVNTGQQRNSILTGIYVHTLRATTSSPRGLLEKRRRYMFAAIARQQQHEGSTKERVKTTTTFARRNSSLKRAHFRFSHVLVTSSQRDPVLGYERRASRDIRYLSMMEIYQLSVSNVRVPLALAFWIELALVIHVIGEMDDPCN